MCSLRSISVIVFYIPFQFFSSSPFFSFGNFLSSVLRQELLLFFRFFFLSYILSQFFSFSSPFFLFFVTCFTSRISFFFLSLLFTTFLDFIFLLLLLRRFQLFLVLIAISFPLIFLIICSSPSVLLFSLSLLFFRS